MAHMTPTAPQHSFLYHRSTESSGFARPLRSNKPNMTRDTPFRVIIIGAGVAGLSASHCLQRAGIDHVVLERSTEVGPRHGASISFYPQAARILSQMGCLDAMMKSCVPCKYFWTRGPDGKPITKAAFFDFVKENHGERIILLERRKFLQNMYDCLPSKAPIQLGRQVASVQQHMTGVTVTLKDGTVEEGDMIIGCDGVHSPTRSFMWDHANKMQPGIITAKEKTGMGPGTPELGERDMTAISDKRFSFLCITQPTETFWFVFFRLDKEISWPKRNRYTAQDAEAAAASVADHPLSESLVFGELWKRRDRAAMLDIEEGVLDHWFYDRIVLAGDCVHKVTPNIGLGGNMALESVVVLCNHLQAMLTGQRGAKPSCATLNRAFAAYQEERRGRVVEVMEISSLITRMQAWDTPFHKFLATWVAPLQAERAVADQLGEIVRKGPKIAYGSDAAEGFGSGGRLRWADEEGKEEVEKSSRLQWIVSVVTVLMVAMGVTQLGWLGSLLNI
ncbi:hypothetical protein DL765_002909 [Monosporascus sp. GIB2]|nr:hypothetical protein DL765_002909 [Monosporascus sp. GIB2]